MDTTKAESSDSPLEGAILIPEEAAGQSSGPASGISIRAYIILVAVGAFATTFAQQRILGQLPTTLLLKEFFHYKREAISFFFFWATFAWSLKPIAGVLTDAFPIFGTRRKHYMMFGAFAAAILWIFIGVGFASYTILLIGSVLLNAALVTSSTVMGGLMVEAGQAFKAPGRMTSLRQAVQNASLVGGPLLGGFLAGKYFGLTAGVAAFVLLGLGFVTLAVLKERPIIVDRAAPLRPRPNYSVSPGIWIGVVVLLVIAGFLYRNKDLHDLGISLFAQVVVFLMIVRLTLMPTKNAVIRNAQYQLVDILRSRTLWIAAGMLLLVYMVPGLNTALTFRQVDELKFDPKYIGFLTSLEGGVGIPAAIVYALFCRRINLRILLLTGVALSAGATLLYLTYSGSTAWIVHSMGGLTGTLAEIALMDLAVRSTPAGCEALGFSLMMSVRNFGLAMSDLIGSTMMDRYGFKFNQMVVINASTTAVILLLVPLLPRAIMSRKEGETAAA